MRKLLTSLVVWLVGLCWIPAVTAQIMRVMQWNVHGGLGTMADNSAPQAAALARIVNYNQPDVLLLNEVNSSSVAANAAALTVWVTNNLPYMGTSFSVSVSSVSDGFNRNCAISRYPIFAEGTYTSANMIRGLHAFRVQLAGTNVLQVFHAHFKCCHDTGDCGERQTNAVFASNTIRSWAATNSLPYIFAGDWNEDEDNAQCSFFNGYRPITMVRTNGNLVEFLPTTLNGNSKTISTPSPDSRFDYCLAGSNRLSAVSGYVFNSVVWAQNGLYTNASPQNLADDSTTASDHCNVFVNYSFPVGATNFSVMPTGSFTSGGPAGGPFSPSSQIYTLTNSDTIPLFWSVTKTSNWLTVSTLATNLALGAGRSTNITVSVNAAADLLCSGTYTETINFSNTATGASLSRDVTLTVDAFPPVASFTGSPTDGVESLVVTFTDTSTGFITNRFWDFGDFSTTNVATNSVTHTYSAGSHSVTLVVTAPCNVSSNVEPNYINVLTTFQSWQLQYFGCTNCPQAEPDADPLGKGISNTNQFLAGLNPTNPASVFRITSVLVQGTNTVITWATAGGKTNVVQGGVGDLDNNNPAYSNLFFDMSTPIVISGSGDVVTNFFDDGSFWDSYSNWPTHYYRIRLAP
jgi:PKD repeat protein/endonuclease/exonuclease/phosphatase family metal-dependent hydrolase